MNKSTTLFPLMALICGVGWPTAAHAACPSHEHINAILRMMESKQPIRGLSAGLSMQDAACGRRRLVEKLASAGNRIVGYKAGLTSKAAQEKLGVSSPVHGVLLERMLLKDGAEVPAGFGARPVFEPDLLVVVKDAEIHHARSQLDLLRSISLIVPFIELPDLVIAEGEKVSAPLLVMINAGARLGVMGPGIKPQASPEFALALATMRVVVTDQNDRELASGTGAAILDHPLNAMLWLVQDLEKAGVRLKAGDLLSLGSFTAPLTPKAGATVTVRYAGLPGNPAVSVRFK